ncbi:MAG: hypothetical protein QOE93_1905, partial [Actinomycetota bacterium]|nr:hypothetical protein [Actinomycetota bacterium]
MSVLTVGQPRRARMAVLTAAALVGASLISLVGGPPAVAAAGVGTGTSIDASFGGGLVKTTLSTLSDEAFAVVLQPDGSTVVAGSTSVDPYAWENSELFVTRYTSAGKPDPGFGQNGTFILGTPHTHDSAWTLALQPDGRIVVGGQQAGSAVVVRLTPAGALDPDFQGGVVTFPALTFPDAQGGGVMAVAVQPDGRIRVVGTGWREEWSGGQRFSTFFQARLNPDGTRDATFAPAGLIITDSPVGVTFTTMILGADGKLLAAGGTDSGFLNGGWAYLYRYRATGELDPGFGSGGVVVVNSVTDFVDWTTSIKGLAIQPDGRILATGSLSTFASLPFRPPTPGSSPPAPTGMQHTSYSNLALFRFLPDGRPDASFSMTGTVVTRVPGQPGTAVSGGDTLPTADTAGKAVALAPDGSIMVSGWTSRPFSEGVLLRYTSAGVLDTTFGHAGVLSFDMGGGTQSVVNAVAFRPDGRLAVAGATWIGFSGPGYLREVLVGRIVPGSRTGTVWTWGWNGLGQLGDGTATSRSAPVPVPGLSGIVAVSASPYHSLALQGDGTVWAWGWNALGQLGDGTTVSRMSPIKVPGLTGVVAVAAGGLHSLALRGDGTVWAWGYNGSGQLGDGTIQMRLTPTRTLLRGITAISAGLFHNLAIREEGTGWAWGYNGQGQLGDGTFVNRASPVAIYGMVESFERVSAGWLHSAAVGSRFTGMLWGYDQLGQLSDAPAANNPNMGNYLGPTVDVSAGGYHTISSRKGVIRSRGWNAFGQLGRAPDPYNLVPGAPTWSSVSAGGLHNLALTPDHRIVVWGWNYYGQLGTGT